MLKENIEALVSKLENLVSTRTVVGEAITIGNNTVVPVISASFGFGTASGEGTEPSKGGGKGGGAGAGAHITPTALIALEGDQIRVYSLNKKGALENLVEVVPEVLSKFHKSRNKAE